MIHPLYNPTNRGKIITHQRWVFCLHRKTNGKRLAVGRNMGVSKNKATPKWMVKIMENLIKMDDLGVPLFSETSIWNMSEKRVTPLGGSSQDLFQWSVTSICKPWSSAIWKGNNPILRGLTNHGTSLGMILQALNLRVFRTCFFLGGDSKIHSEFLGDLGTAI